MKEMTYDEAVEALKNLEDGATMPLEQFMALSKVHKDDPAEDNWDDPLAMFKDIKSHVQKEGGEIVEEDRPLNFRIAYRCVKTNKTWSFRIGSLKEIMNKYRMIESSLQSVEGKNSLLRALNNE